MIAWAFWVLGGGALVASIALWIGNQRDRNAVNAVFEERKLQTPEGMWRGYSQNDMVRIMHEVPRGIMERYAGPVLRRDGHFAAVYAVAGALLSVAMALTWPEFLYLKWLGPYMAVMVVIYGVADVAEDYLLRQIIMRSLGTIQGAAGGSDTARDEHMGVDPAQVDAASALTLVKMVTLTASVAWVVVWRIISVAAQMLVRGTGGMGDPTAKPPSRELAGAA